MNFDEYHQAAIRTLRKVPGATNGQLSTALLGLAGEVGEVIDPIKKHFERNVPLDVVKVRDELGDVLWYVTAVAELLDINLDTIARSNIEKLKKRWPNGFTGIAQDGE